MWISGIVSLFVILFVSMLLFLWMIYRKLEAIVDVVKERREYLYLLLDWRRKIFRSIHLFSKDEAVLLKMDALFYKAEEAKKQRALQEYMKTENQISQWIGVLETTLRKDPKLIENKELMSLIEDITSLQTELNWVQKSYNQSLEKYYATRSSFLDSLLVLLFPYQLRLPYSYWRIERIDKTRSIEKKD